MKKERLFTIEDLRAGKLPTHYRNKEKFEGDVFETKTKLYCGENILVVNKNGNTREYANNGSYFLVQGNEHDNDLMILDDVTNDELINYFLANRDCLLKSYDNKMLKSFMDFLKDKKMLVE